jgi:hypothetical protein
MSSKAALYLDQAGSCLEIAQRIGQQEAIYLIEAARAWNILAEQAMEEEAEAHSAENSEDGIRSPLLLSALAFKTWNAGGP